MIMNWFFTGCLALSILCSLKLGNGPQLAAAVAAGGKDAVQLTLGLAGSLCLWSGVGHLAQKAGLTQMLTRLLRPILDRLFPESRKDPALADSLSGNICANLLGLGNAATPMGIRAAKALADPTRPGLATDSMCRLIVLNTASIQLLPTTVAALRAAQGSAAPMDILPAVWLTSLCSAGLGVAGAWLLGKVWKS